MSTIETAKAPQAQQQSGLLLDVKDLRVTFKTPDGDVTAVNDLNFNLRAGETLGIVGESGSGKSQTAFALMGLLASNGQIGGSALFNGRQILNLPERDLNKLRAEQISMIFQDPMTSLNPYMRVGEQLMEVLMLHKGLGKAEAFEESVKMLDAEGDALLTIPGNPPNLLRLPKGCPFQPRCPHAMEICNSAPPLEEFAPGRLRACFQPVGDLL